MNILLAFRAEPDLPGLTERDWQAAAEGTQGPETAWIRRVLGPDEQAAAEVMLSNRPQDVAFTYTAWNRGEQSAAPLMRQLAALGFGPLVQASPLPGSSVFHPGAVAQALAEYVQQHPQHLIICGSQSSEGNNGQVPWQVAARLGWPCLAGVVDFTVDAGDILVEQELDGYRHRRRVRPPMVFAMINNGRYALRVPTVQQKMAAAKVAIARQTATAIAAPAPTCCQLTRPTSGRAGHIISGNSPEEKARILWEEWLKPELAQ